MSSSDSDEVGLVVQHALSADTSTSSHDEVTWIVDSGATSHICNGRTFFCDLKTLEKPVDITLGDGHSLTATRRGTVILLTKSGPLKKKCKLHDVLYVPELTYSLVSVSKGTENGISFTFGNNGCVIKDTNRKLITVAKKVGNLYHIPNVKPQDYICAAIADSECNASKEHPWHRRYGHLGSQNLERLVKEELVHGFDYCTSKSISFCEPCLKGKQQRGRFPTQTDRKTTVPLELIHSDVCGKMSSRSLSGCEYFVTFIDDYTRYVWVYVIKRKSEVFEKFCEWKKEVENSLGQRVRAFRRDNGGEYTSEEFKQYFKKEGIKHQYTIPKCPEQNGTAERLNRTLIEMVRSMLMDSELPKVFWAEALSTATYI